MINATNDTIRYISFKYFLEKGYEGTNIRDICGEVDIKASSLYFYYSSKQELFLSLYDEVYGEYLDYLHGICELSQNTTPKMKLYTLYKKSMEYYTRDLIKQKFLLRYHLFPPEEVAASIRDKFKFWTNEENKIIVDIINQGMERKVIDDSRTVTEYLNDFKRFCNSQVIEMIIYNTKLSEEEMDKLWIKFWSCTMLNCI